MPSSRGSSPPREATWVSGLSSTGRQVLYPWATREALRETQGRVILWWVETSPRRVGRGMPGSLPLCCFAPRPRDWGGGRVGDLAAHPRPEWRWEMHSLGLCVQHVEAMGREAGMVSCTRCSEHAVCPPSPVTAPTLGTTDHRVISGPRTCPHPPAFPHAPSPLTPRCACRPWASPSAPPKCSA